MSEKVELGRCPFCASLNASLIAVVPSRIRVVCMDCSASSGWFNDEQEAVETWNTVSELMERER